MEPTIPNSPSHCEVCGRTKRKLVYGRSFSGPITYSPPNLTGPTLFRNMSDIPSPSLVHPRPTQTIANTTSQTSSPVNPTDCRNSPIKISDVTDLPIAPASENRTLTPETVSALLKIKEQVGEMDKQLTELIEGCTSKKKLEIAVMKSEDKAELHMLCYCGREHKVVQPRNQ